MLYISESYLLLVADHISNVGNEPIAVSDVTNPDVIYF